MIRIEKIKLHADGSAKIRYVADGDALVTAEYSKRIAHQDFIDAMQNLTAHLFELCELGIAAYDNELDPIILKGYETTQIVFGGDGESYGCTLVGKKILAGNRVLNLVAPFIMFTDDERHPRIDQLYIKSMRVYNEAVEYLNGKSVPDPQLQMEL